MYAVTKRKPASSFATFAIIAVFTLVFTSGLFSMFFENKLNEFFHYLDVHIKAISGIIKVVVFVSGIIWLTSPIVILCCVYTLIKDHRDDKESSINRHSNSDLRNPEWFSPQVEKPTFNSGFDDEDFDDFMESELEKLRNDLAARREGYLSIYNSGPLFLTEARDRFKNKMTLLLDIQDEEILSMYAELHWKIKSQVKHYRKQMKVASKNGKSSVYLLNDYLNQMEDFCSELYAEFAESLADLNIQLHELSDDHFDTLQNLSKTFSRY